MSQGIKVENQIVTVDDMEVSELPEIDSKLSFKLATKQMVEGLKERKVTEQQWEEVKLTLQC